MRLIIFSQPSVFIRGHLHAQLEHGWVRGRTWHPPNGPFVTCTRTFDQECRLLMLKMHWKALDRALNMSQAAAQGDTVLQALLGRSLRGESARVDLLYTVIPLNRRRCL